MGARTVDATLKIVSSDLAAEELQALTREVSQTVNKETEVSATLPEVAGERGTKGDPITLSTIVLTALSSGTVVALFNVLKTFLERRPSLEKLQRTDGQKFKVRAEHLDKTQLEQTMKLANEFLRS